MDGARNDDKQFELAMVEFSIFPKDWPLLAAEHLKKPEEEVIKYYDDLVHDVDLIESGSLSVPDYVDNLSPTEARQGSSQSKENEKKKGIPWTDEEHENFLKGLEEYGKGDWKSIACFNVVTRTPSQVASHAEKYYQRQLQGREVRKRSSIHDKTFVHAEDGVTNNVPSTELHLLHQTYDDMTWLHSDDSVINDVPATEFHPIHQTQYDHDMTWVDADDSVINEVTGTKHHPLHQMQYDDSIYQHYFD